MNLKCIDATCSLPEWITGLEYIKTQGNPFSDRKSVVNHLNNLSAANIDISILAITVIRTPRTGLSIFDDDVNHYYIDR
jgi:hypothetical protein